MADRPMPIDSGVSDAPSGLFRLVAFSLNALFEIKPTTSANNQYSFLKASTKKRLVTASLACQCPIAVAIPDASS